jgi:hypothetical protein
MKAKTSAMISLDQARMLVAHLSGKSLNRPIPSSPMRVPQCGGPV